VHQRVYWPSRAEVEPVLEEARELLTVLAHALEVHDDFEMYRNGFCK